MSVTGAIQVSGNPTAIGVGVGRAGLEAVAVAACVRALRRRIEEACVQRQGGQGAITPSLDVEDAQSSCRRHQQDDSENNVKDSGQGQAPSPLPLCHGRESTAAKTNLAGRSASIGSNALHTTVVSHRGAANHRDSHKGGVIDLGGPYTRLIR